MIATLDIKGFKSVKEVHLDCKRINLFIGEPNTGKSNILEALGFLCWCAHGGNLIEYVRLEQLRDLFHDGNAAKEAWRLTLTAADKSFTVHGCFDNGLYIFDSSGGAFARGRQPGELGVHSQKQFDFIHFYRFKTLAKYPWDEGGVLRPPNGDNLVSLLHSSKGLRQLAGDYFLPSGLLFVIKPLEHIVEIQKQSEGVAVSFPYSIASDTLQRMVFYATAIESNREATLVFEEPETHAFPYFTKHLGERIALDENKNQYFIATHNPYLLTAIWEKATASEVAVFATYCRDYETRVKLLTEKDMTWLFEADPFLGISHLVEDEP